MKTIKWFDLKKDDEISMSNPFDKRVVNYEVKEVCPTYIIVGGEIEGDIPLHSSILEMSKIKKINLKKN